MGERRGDRYSEMVQRDQRVCSADPRRSSKLYGRAYLFMDGLTFGVSQDFLASRLSAKGCAGYCWLGSTAGAEELIG